MNFLTLLCELHRRTFFAPDEGGGSGAAAPATAAEPAAAATETTKTETTTEKKPASPAKTHEESVPYDRFKSVNDAKAAAEKAAAEARAELTKIQRSGLPELDQVKAERDDLKRQLEEATGKATAAEQRATTIERGGWVRAAAQAAGFHDAEDAIARIDVSSVRTEDGARRAVEALAESAKHLVKAKDDASHAGVLREVLAGGKQTDANGGDKKLIPASQLEQMSQDDHVALMERDPDLYHRSLAAAEAA